MQVFTLSAETKSVDVNLTSAGHNISAIALEVIGFGETSLTSISAPDIQDIGSGLYRITFDDTVLSRQGFLLFNLVSSLSEFTPFVGVLFTTLEEGSGGEVISGIPPSKDGFLPVQAFSSGSPVLDLTDTDFTITFTRADEVNVNAKTLVAADVIQVLNEFSTKRGIYLIQFKAAELNRIGNFKYTSTGGSFDTFDLEIQIATPNTIGVTFEVRDTSPGVISPVPALPTATDPSFIGTSAPINRIEFDLAQFGFGYTLTFNYYNGTIFTPLVVTDGTENFTKEGVVTWVLPVDQVAGAISAGAPNDTDYFIKVETAAVAGAAQLAKINAGVLLEGVNLSIVDVDGAEEKALVTGDQGEAKAALAAAIYTTILTKDDKVFNSNNVKTEILETPDAQTIVLEGANTIKLAPSVAPSLIRVKVDLVNLSGTAVHRQGIQLNHKFTPVFFSGTNTVIGRSVRLVTDVQGHAEARVIAGAIIDVTLTDTPVIRTVTIPQVRSGTGDSTGTAPTPSFKAAAAASFTANDVNALITIGGIQHVITLVLNDTDIEVSPDIATDLTGASWTIDVIDLFSLISLAPDQFQVAVPTLDAFAIRTTL